MYQSPKRAANQVAQLKTLPFCEQHEIVRGLRGSKFGRFVNGPLKKSEFGKLASFNHFTPTSDWINEVQWFFHSFEVQKNKIQLFENERKNFLTHFLLADYDKASSALDQIDKNLGKSSWLLSQRFLILNEVGNTIEKNALFSESTPRSCSPSNAVLAYLLANRSDPDTTIRYYENLVEEFLGAPDYASAQIILHLIHHLAFYYRLPIEAFNQVVCIESTYPTVDRYLTAKKLLALGFQSDHINRGLIVSATDSLNNVVGSSSVSAFSFMIGQSCEKHNLNLDINNKALEALDAYTIGNYDLAIEMAGSLIGEYPFEFLPYLIFTKSLIRGGREFTIGLPNDSIAYEITSRLFDVYSENRNQSTALIRLRKIAYNLSACHLSEEILHLCRIHQLHDRNILRYADSDIVNPGVLDCLPEINQKEFYGKFLDTFEHCKTIELLAIEKGPSSGGGIAKDIPKLRVLRSRANAAFVNGETETAIAIINEILDDDDGLTPWDRSSIMSLLYRIYEKCDDWVSCLKLSLSIEIEKPITYRRLPIGNLLERAKIEKGSSLHGMIELPVFLNLRNVDNHLIYRGYHTFLKKLGVNRPSDLFNNLELIRKIDLNLVRTFLDTVCVPDVMTLAAVEFSTLQEVEDERILICQFLMEDDKDNHDEYIKEIAEISQRQFNRKGLDAIDRSRITVDGDALIQDFTDQFEPEFKRFVNLESSPEARREIVDPYQILLDFNRSLQKNADDQITVRVFTPQSQVLFRDILKGMENLFIKSPKYGLEANICTRIRHGTLLGQLRSPYQKERLITVKEASSGSYQKNKFWIQRAGNYGEDGVSELETLLETLSQSVDKISVELKDELIQIKSKEKPKGLFDIAVSETQTMALAIGISESSSFENFSSFLLSFFWNKLDQCLHEIRGLLNNSIKVRLVSSLTDLEADIQSLHLDSSFKRDLLNAVARTRTDVQTEVDNITNWFNLPERQDISGFNFVQVLDMVLDTAKNVEPNLEIEAKKNVEANPEFKGGYFVSFYHLLLILVDNVVKHGARNSGKVELNVETVVESGSISLKVSNPLNEESGIDEDIETLENIAAVPLNQLAEYTRVEGKSGYGKLRHILGFDLVDQEHTLNFFGMDGEIFVVELRFNIEQLLK